jgi:hypothetical protein
VGPRADLDAVKLRKIYCTYQESNSGPTSPQPIGVRTKQSRLHLGTRAIYKLLLNLDFLIVYLEGNGYKAS